MLVEKLHCQDQHSIRAFTHFLSYLPNRCNPSGEYIQNRQEVFNLQAGNYSNNVLSLFQIELSNLLDKLKGEFHLIPIPAETQAKRELKYFKLCEELSTIPRIHFDPSLMIQTQPIPDLANSDKFLDEISDFWKLGDISGKNIIFIGDLYSYGYLHLKISDELYNKCNTFYTLYLARTAQNFENGKAVFYTSHYYFIRPEPFPYFKQFDALMI